MQLPDYWLPCPVRELDAATQKAFDEILDDAIAHDGCPLLEYSLAAPKWQFLNYAAAQRDIALHGSGNPAIARFEPRQPIDLTEFGNQNAVYAAADGIWAMFYAILDRDTYALTMANACIQIVTGETSSQSLYHFSISRGALAQNPWRNGTVYLLPRATFVEQPAVPFDSVHVKIPQLASLVALSPLARIQVAPSDFPFLENVRGHDDARLHDYMIAMQTGAPLPKA